MNKLANVVAALAALLIVGLPGVLGSVTEAQVRARVAEVSASGVATAEIRSFERGWFRGRAKIDLALSPEYVRSLSSDRFGAAAGVGGLAGRTAPIDVELAFGPIAFLDGVHFGVSRMIATLDRGYAAVGNLERTLNVPYVFEFRGTANFLGTLAFDADVPAVDLATSTARLQFAGALLSGTLSGRRLAAAASVAKLELVARSGTLVLESALADVDHEIRSAYALPGQARFSVGRFSITDTQRTARAALDVTGLAVDATIAHDADAGLLDVQSSLTLGSAIVEGKTLADAHVGLVLRRVDAAALEAYVESMRAADAGAVDPEAALGDVLAALGRGLAAGPSLALEPVRFEYDGEPFMARMEIVTNPAALPDGSAIDVLDVGALLGAVDGFAEVELSKKLAQELASAAMRAQLSGQGAPAEQQLLAEAQTGLMIVMLVTQGLITDTGAGYRAELRIADGAVTLNGAALPFSVR